MNIWVAVWGGGPELNRRAEQALRSTVPLFPQLDPCTFTALEPEAPAWAAAVTGPPRPGRAGAEVAMGARGLVIVDGVAVHDGRDALRADTVLAKGTVDAERLEGQFAVVQCTPDSLHIDNDALGLRHLYHWRRGDTWIFANTVEVIARTVGGELDAEGVSLFLTLGWTAGDTTLWSGVRQVPGGRSWHFDSSGAALGEHFSRAELAGNRTWRYDPYPVGVALEDQVRAVASIGDGVQVAMSGGLDSRLMAALVDHSGVPADYYSVGDPESYDGVTAPLLVRSIGADHVMYEQSLDDVMAGWDGAVESYVAQNDGLAGMWVMGDVIGMDALKARNAVVLQGVAGELARWNRTPLKLQVNPSRELSLRHLTRRFDKVGLATAGARELAIAHVARFLDEAEDEGFGRYDLLPVWYMSERARRWGGANNRKISNLNDVFTPFTTRPFMRASFRLKGWRGYGEPIHHDLVKRLSPPLYAQPPETGSWLPQVPFLNVAVDRRQQKRRRQTMTGEASRSTYLFKQDLWPGRLRKQLAERYLDDGTSRAWDLVDRPRFEQLLTGDDEAPRRRAAEKILQLCTVLEYDRQRRAAPVANC